MFAFMEIFRFIWLPCVFAFIQPFTEDPCRWEPKIVDSLDLASFTSPRPDPATKNLTGILENIQIDFLNNRTDEEYFGYPSFLQLQLTCPDLDPETTAGIVGSTGSNPRVIYRLTSYDETTLRPIKRVLMDVEGVLVYVSDTAQLQGEDYEFLKTNWSYVNPIDTTQYDKSSPSTKAIIPQYIWLVPYTIAPEMQGVDITILPPSTGLKQSPKRFTMNRDYYTGISNSGPLSPSQISIQNIPDSLFTGFPLSTTNTLMTFPLPSVLGNSSVLLYSSDGWATSFGFSFSLPGSPVLCANGQSNFTILSYAVLHNRILVATNYGVLQFLSDPETAKSPGVPGASLILNQCVNTIRLPQIDNPNGAFVTMLTDTGDLYWTPYFNPSGVFNFTKVIASGDLQNAATSMIPGYGAVQAFDIVAADSLGILVLVKATSPTYGNPVSQKFCVVSVGLSAASPLIGLKTCVPGFIPQTNGSLPVNIASDTAMGNDSFVVSRFLQSEFNSREAYAFGNATFFTSDSGSSWMYFPSFRPGRTVKTAEVVRAAGKKIIVLAATDSGEQEVWITTWGQAEMYKLYPSYAWEMSLLLGSAYSDIGAVWQNASSKRLLTVHTDTCGNVRQLFAVKQSTGSWRLLNIPLQYAQITASMSNSLLSAISSNSTSGNFQPAYCPEVSVTVEKRYSLDRLENFQFKNPRTERQTFYDHPEVATAYSALAHALFEYSLKSMDNNYSSSEAGNIENISGYFDEGPFPDQWDFENIVARAEPRRIVVLSKDYKNAPLADGNLLLAEFPQEIFIDRGDSVSVKLSFYDFVPKGSFGSEDTSDFPQISFRMANGSLLSGRTDVTYDADKQTVHYTLTFLETGTLTPAPPGATLAKESLSILLPSPLQCYPNQAVYDTTVNIGCLPVTELQYNWELVLQSSTTNTTFFDCTDPVPNMPCIDHSGNVNMYLELVDHAANLALNFTGRYRLFVIGFGMGSPDNIVRFAESDLPTYNTDFPDGSNSKKLIWSPMNDSPLYANDTRILDHFHNKIQFVCASDSPCGDPAIEISEEPHLNFLVRVTNRGLPDVDTYCLFELEFVMRIRGADPNPYTVSIPVLLVTTAVLCILCGFYVVVYF